VTVTVTCVKKLWHHIDSLYYIQNKIKKEREREKNKNKNKRNLNDKREVKKEQVYHPWI